MRPERWHTHTWVSVEAGAGEGELWLIHHPNKQSWLCWGKFRDPGSLNWINGNFSLFLPSCLLLRWMKATQLAALPKACSPRGSRTDLPAPFLPLWDPSTALAHPKLCSPSPTRSLPHAPHAEWASVASSGPPPKSLPPILTRLPLLGASSFSPDQEKVRNCSCYFRRIHGTSGLGPCFTCGGEVSADEACANCSLSLSLTMSCGFLTCWPLGVTSAGPWTPQGHLHRAEDGNHTPVLCLEILWPR